MIEPDEVADDGLLASPFIVGAPVALLEKFPIGRELEYAYNALDRYLDGEPRRAHVRGDGRRQLDRAADPRRRGSESRSSTRTAWGAPIRRCSSSR